MIFSTLHGGGCPCYVTHEYKMGPCSSTYSKTRGEVHVHLTAHTHAPASHANLTQLARADSPPYSLFHTNSIHAHKVYSCTQSVFMHTKCIHAHKPNHWPEENKNNKKLVQNSRHHDRPHHLVLPTHFTAQRLQSPWPPSPSCLTTHFTAQRLQSPSCLSHTLHATEATVTTAAVRPPTQCKHSETRRTRKRKRKEKEKRKRKKGKEQCP